MKIGIMYSGLTCINGADYTADFLCNAVLNAGHDLCCLGGQGLPQVTDIPTGLDVLIHVSGHGISNNPELVERFKKKTKVFLWTHNDEMGGWHAATMRITNLVDMHFSYTREHSYGPHVKYLPLAADNTVYHCLNIPHKKYDVSMVGWPHAWRVKFTEALQKYYKNSYFSFSMRLPHTEVNRLYNNTRVVIAPVQDCDQNLRRSCFGCPCRTFDVPAAGAFQIQVARKGLSDVYSNPPVLPYVEDATAAAQLWKDAIDAWLASEDRETIARDMMAETLRKNLYVHRLKTMLAYL